MSVRYGVDDVLDVLTEGAAARGKSLPLEVPGPVLVIPGIIPTDLCDDIVTVYKRRTNWTATNDGKPLLDLYNDALAGDPFVARYLDPIRELCQAAIGEVWHFPRLDIVRLQVLHYRDGARHVAHRDGALNPLRQWVGIVVQLSDPDTYEGGDLCVEGDEPRRIPAGSVTLIPGHLVHWVTPVTAGDRYTLTCFACGPAVPA